MNYPLESGADAWRLKEDRCVGKYLCQKKNSCTSESYSCISYLRVPPDETQQRYVGYQVFLRSNRGLLLLSKSEHFVSWRGTWRREVCEKWSLICFKANCWLRFIIEQIMVFNHLLMQYLEQLGFRHQKSEPKLHLISDVNEAWGIYSSFWMKPGAGEQKKKHRTWIHMRTAESFLLVEGVCALVTSVCRVHMVREDIPICLSIIWG